MSRKYRLKEKYRRKLSHFLLCQMKIMIAISLTVIGMNSFLTNVHAQNETYGIYKADGKIYACDEGALDSSISNEIDIENVTYLYIHRDVTEIDDVKKAPGNQPNVHTVKFLGTQVQSINNSAFSNFIYLENILRLEFQSNLETIGGDVFYGTKLKSIQLPSSIKNIDNIAFSGCSVLEKIIVNGTNGNYYSQDDVLFKKANGTDKATLWNYPQGKTNKDYSIPSGIEIINSYAFLLVNHLKNVTIPATVTDINQSAFNSANVENISFENGSQLKNIGVSAFSSSSINEIVLPEELESIGMDAFSHTRLKTINIPISVTSIDNYAFFDCSNMTAINVAEGNQNYKSDDGVLYTRNGKTLLSYPSAKKINTYTILDGVNTIVMDAFTSAKNTSYIVIPNSVNQIGEFAFSDSLIKGILFEGPLPSFGVNVFEYVQNLKLYTLNNNDVGRNQLLDKDIELYTAPLLTLEETHEGETRNTYQIQPTLNADASFKDDMGFTYISSNPAIASVNSTGLVTFHQRGTTNIKVTATDPFRHSESIMSINVKEQEVINDGNQETPPTDSNNVVTPSQPSTKPQGNQKESNSNKDKNQPVQTNDQTMLIEMIGMLLLSGIGILSLRRKEG